MHNVGSENVLWLEIDYYNYYGMDLAKQLIKETGNDFRSGDNDKLSRLRGSNSANSGLYNCNKTW